MPKHKRIFLDFLPLVLLYLINWIGDTFFYVYYFFPDFDIIMHFFGGMFVARFLFSLWDVYAKKFHMVVKPQRLFFGLLVSMVGMVTFVWEVYEELHDRLFDSAFQNGTGDLLLDMFLGILGGCFWYYLSKRWGRLGVGIK